jgi:hypothetical protein
VDQQDKRREAIAGAAVVALCGLAAKVDAPAFPYAGDSAAVQEWIVDVMRRVGRRLPTEQDIRFLRYLAGDYETPAGRPQNATHQQLVELTNRLEKGNP